MDKALTGSIDFLHAQGLSGILIMGLVYVIWRMAKYIADIQEKRIDESRRAVEAMERNSAAFENLSQVIRAGNRRDA